MAPVEMSSVYWHDFANLEDALSAINVAKDVLANAQSQQQKCYQALNEGEVFNDEPNVMERHLVKNYQGRLDSGIVEDNDAAFIDHNNASKKRTCMSRSRCKCDHRRGKSKCLQNKVENMSSKRRKRTRKMLPPKLIRSPCLFGPEKPESRKKRHKFTRRLLPPRPRRCKLTGGHYKPEIVEIQANNNE